MWTGLDPLFIMVSKDVTDQQTTIYYHIPKFCFETNVAYLNAFNVNLAIIQAKSIFSSIFLSLFSEKPIARDHHKQLYHQIPSSRADIFTFKNFSDKCLNNPWIIPIWCNWSFWWWGTPSNHLSDTWKAKWKSSSSWACHVHKATIHFFRISLSLIIYPRISLMSLIVGEALVVAACWKAVQ